MKTEARGEAVGRAPSLRDTAWVLLGGLLGTTLCFFFFPPRGGFVTIDAVSFLSMAAVAMLVASARAPAASRHAHPRMRRRS